MRCWGLLEGTYRPAGATGTVHSAGRSHQRAGRSHLALRLHCAAALIAVPSSRGGRLLTVRACGLCYMLPQGRFGRCVVVGALPCPSRNLCKNPVPPLPVCTVRFLVTQWYLYTQFLHEATVHQTWEPPRSKANMHRAQTRRWARPRRSSPRRPRPLQHEQPTIQSNDMRSSRAGRVPRRCSLRGRQG